jgi:transcriptional regulator with XRE-family HTH domain
MATTADRAASNALSPKEVGRQLRHVRRKQGLSRSEVARSAGLTRRELAAYERGRSAVPESDLWCLAGSCGVDVGELLPNRTPVTVSSDLSLLAVGDSIKYLRNPVDDDELLREYLAMIYQLRNLPPGSKVPLRERDLMSLADALGGSPERIEERLVEIIGMSRQEAARLRAMILPPRALPPPADGMANPYEQLPTTEGAPEPRPGDGAVVDFFSVPRAPDPFEPPPPPGAVRSAEPATWEEGYDALPVTPADPFAAPPPMAVPEPMPMSAPAPAPASAASPIEPAAYVEEPGHMAWTASGAPPDAIVVDEVYTSDSIVIDRAPMDDAPLADAWSVEPLPPVSSPPPLRPEPPMSAPAPPMAPPFAEPAMSAPAPPMAPSSAEPAMSAPAPAIADPEPPIVAPEPPMPMPTPMPMVETPAAATAAPVVDRPVHDDPLPRREPRHADVPGLEPFSLAPSAPLEPAPLHAPVAPIAWVAVDEPESDPLGRPVDGPQFERAGSDWRIGGIFPATAAADDGALALRRADARWALADIDAPGDFTIEASVDFSAGPGFGVLFRASVDDADRVSGYSFDIDPIAGGGGYLVRQWEDNRQHWRPLAQAPVTDATRLLGRHNISVTFRADQLSVMVDGENVLTIPALSRVSLEMGRPPCRGNRTGVQAWATTEVTVDSFRVARH